jgi:hypothetical protein
LHRAHRLPDLTVGLILTSCLALGSTHYIAANGSDSNNGTSKTPPWLHAPGMPACSSACAAYTPAAGDSVIFRGGDTWHFGNSSASPYVGAGGWAWRWSGSSASNVIYIGVDQTWFSGSSWARPILNEDNPLNPRPGVVNSQVASCPFQVSGGNQEINIQASNVTFDNFEFTGFCWNSNTYGNGIMLKITAPSSPNGDTVEHCYVHGWTNTAAGQAEGGTWLESYNQEPGLSMLYNVVDGSDSDPSTLNYQIGDLYTMAYNVIRYNQGQNSTSGCHLVHDNLFEHMDNVADGSGAHSDVLQCYGETGNGSGDPNLFYNNLFRYIPDTGDPLSNNAIWFFPPTGQTDYAFNNVAHDITAGPNYFMLNQSGGPGGGNLALYNNTMVQGSSGYIIRNNMGGGGTVTSINNSWITTGSQSSVFGTPSTVTETSALYTSPTIALTQGYISANDFAPTLLTNLTVTASGSNNTSFCNGLSNSAAKAACESGTTNGCVYNTANHSVSCPAIAAVGRPSTGSWNVGAYQFSGSVNVGNPLLPFSSLTAASQ